MPGMWSGELASRSLALASELLAEMRLIKDGAVHDEVRYPARGDFDDALAGTPPDVPEHLVGPAQRMRSQNDIVKLQERVVGIDRLLLEDVQSGPLNAAALQD